MFQCVYFQTETGKIPVKDFIDELHKRTQHKYFAVVHLLECYGKKLPKPHVDSLRDDIFELRFVGVEGQIRILYFFYDMNKIVFTNAFIKKQQKTPHREIDLAIQRRKVYFINKG